MAQGPGFGVRTPGTASYRRSPLGLSQESEGRAGVSHAVPCHSIRERDVLLPCVGTITSAQKGPGDHPGQPSHLAAESDPRGDRGLPKVTGQVRGRAKAKLQASCPSASACPLSLSLDRNPWLETHRGRSLHGCGIWLAWDLPSSSHKAPGPYVSGRAHQNRWPWGQAGVPWDLHETTGSPSLAPLPGAAAL